MSTRTSIRLAAAAAAFMTFTLTASTVGAVPGPVPGPGDMAPPPPGPDVPGVSIDDAWGYEADGSILFTLTLDEPAELGDNVGIGFTHLDTASEDFLATGFNYVFVGGQTEATLPVDLAQFDGVEAPEDFQLYLLDPDGLEIEDGLGDGTIYDGDGPVINIADDAVVEGDEGDTTTLAFEVELSYGVPEELQMRFATTAVPGEAAPTTDYESVDEVMHWAPNATSASYVVEVVEDGLTEAPAEAVSVWIADPSVGTIQDDTAVGTIQDDDLPIITVDDPTEVEGTGGLTDLVFTVALDQPAPFDVDVDASLVAGTATTPADVNDPGPTTLTIPAGETTHEVVLSIVGDATVEPDEDLTLVLQNEQMATLGDGVGLGTILDDDAVAGSGDPGDGDGTSVADAARSRLPFTGASTVALGSAGGLLLSLGLLLMLWRRRRPAMA